MSKVQLMKARVKRLRVKPVKKYKLKTKSSAKKRFSFTEHGYCKSSQAMTRHNKCKRSARSIRNQRGTVIMCAAETTRIRKYLPYSAY